MSLPLPLRPHLSPNVYSIGDRAKVKDGRFWQSCKIIGFPRDPGHLVRIVLPDGARRQVAYSKLRRVA
jgi:hypothetical protein